MRNMFAEAIAKACNGQLVNGEAALNVEIQGAVIDSRLVEKDYLFFATKGQRVDGHDFIAQVFEKGAALVVCEYIPEGVTGPCILVKDSFQALKDIARFYRDGLDVKVVGITGSVGKTSTKEFIASVLSQKYNTLKTDKNFNNEVGLPLTVLKIREEHQVAVLEMGISDFGEMTRLSQIAQPDIAVITNIGTCHLENLIDRDGVLKAKTEIFQYLNAEGCACLFRDDDKLATVTEVNGKAPVFFGMTQESGVYPVKVLNRGIWGSECSICVAGETFDASVPLPGKHMIYNALAATAVGSLLGLNTAEIKAGIENVKPVEGRSNLISKNGLVIIDDCYNANPVSMKSAVDLLCEAVTPTVAILGDMFELGENEVAFHREVGEYAVKKGIDTLVCIGALSENMAEGGKAAVLENSKTDVYYFATKEEFLAQVETIIHKDDTVLIKASHGMGFAELVSALTDEDMASKLSPRVSKLFGEEKEEQAETTVSDDSIIFATKEEENKTFKPKVKFELTYGMKKTLIIAGAVVATALLIGIIIGVVKTNIYQNKVQGFMLYKMGNETLGEKAFKDVVYSQDETTFQTENYEGQGLSVIGDKTMKSDGTYLYFVKNAIGGKYDLFYAKKNSKLPALIAGNVTDYDVISKGEIYYAANDGLYRYEVKSGAVSLISQNATTFAMNKKKSACIFLGANQDLSYAEVKNPGALQTLATGVSEVVCASEDLNCIVFYQNGGLQLLKDKKTQTFIVEGISECLVSNLNGKGNQYIYYLDSDNTLCCFASNKTNPEALLSKIAHIYKGEDLDCGFIVEDLEGKKYYIENNFVHEIKNLEGTIKDGSVVTDGDRLYYVVNKDGIDSLCYVSVNMFTGATSKVSSKVEENFCSSIELMKKKNKFIIKEGENGRKDLYYEKSIVARNVIPGTVIEANDGETVVFLYADMDQYGNNKVGIYSGGSTKEGGYCYGDKIEAVTDKKIYYKKNTAEGVDLARYNGRKDKIIVTNVDDFTYMKY